MLQETNLSTATNALIFLRIINKRKENKFFTIKVLSQKSIDEESKLLNAFETIGLRSKENKKDRHAHSCYPIEFSSLTIDSFSLKVS